MEKQGELFKDWEQDKKHDIIGYRNRSYVSTMTGTRAPPLHDDWLSILDDSSAAFLANDYAAMPVLPQRRASRSPRFLTVVISAGRGVSRLARVRARASGDTPRPDSADAA
ncbi:hypothetical protein GCM10022381_26540 [Leifsonia kafniensis]|uniref:Uncharacterized protein n=1 Tax=Leifsonia kafniensis TaxID=475957 RepID=A0ABP7KQ71_9MICO